MITEPDGNTPGSLGEFKALPVVSSYSLGKLSNSSNPKQHHL